jgi:NADPH-dependent 2,4-dienoyl-CoA reductase/sulfur reductase-like enzyme
MTKFELIVAGGGLTAARAIKSYREAGGAGRIALLGKETALPYHRPALSKRYLRGETVDAPFVEDEAFYTDRDVDLLLGAPVGAVDPGARVVTAANGARYRYRKLLIATGAEPRRLNVPGAGLDGVYTLRTLADSEAIRDAAAQAKRAVVVGGGFIGMEVAASLRALDLEVTLIDPAQGLFARLRSRQLSDELADLYRENRVELLLEEQVSAFEGRTQLAAVSTAAGNRIEADLAVVGIGVVPTLDFLDGSGLQLDNGIVVDDRYQSTAPAVFAAGDIANFFDPLFGRQRRIEHWSNANYQGTQVGQILAGQESRYEAVSSFFTEVFGISLKVFGDLSSFDAYAAEGSLTGQDFVARYGEGGRLVGALSVGQSESDEARLKDLIAARASFVPERPQAVMSVSS